MVDSALCTVAHQLVLPAGCTGSRGIGWRRAQGTRICTLAVCNNSCDLSAAVQAEAVACHACVRSLWFTRCSFICAVCTTCLARQAAASR
eukprot:6039050-Prymnesium_polylepis.1